MIRTKNLTRIYETGDTKLRALDGVDLHIPAGEFTAVVGSSGSGKSTLLHLLGGIDRPTEGRVYIDGVDLYAMESEQLTVFRRRCIGFVFQSFNLLPHLNIWENVTLPLGLDHVKTDRDRIEALLETLGIAEKKNQMPNQLSGGQKQRAAIARALAAGPRIVLADEPTGSLDSRTALEVTMLLSRASEEMGQTVVMITHNEELAQMADRRIRMEDGQIVSDSGGGTEYAET